MDLHDTVAEAEFRHQLRSWLAEAAPPRPADDSLAAQNEAAVAWHRQLYAGGWVGLSWPVEVGGQGLGPVEEAILAEELARADRPPPLGFGYIGRPILDRGTDEQRGRYLPGLLSGEVQWCQGFSEPGAGSDLAAIATRATVQDDGSFRVSGQKVWTSHAQFAEFCLLLVRTDPEADQHAGLSCLIVPLDAPGIEIRPITTIRNDNEFCEVFFDDAPVPAENLVGALGDGWRIAMTTVAFERGPVDIGFQAKYASQLRRLAHSVTDGAVAPRRSFGEVAAAVEVLRLHCLRSLSARALGEVPGPSASIDKLLMAFVEQSVARLGLSCTASASLTTDPDGWLDAYLYSRAATIYGGTAQIQRNIIATRLLGLPRG